ncbi:MAG: hypothetical protein PHI85_11160 [Victivallaceae bacterium]|nr:hypothetical protein [Victivallaceae bacterium]
MAAGAIGYLFYALILYFVFSVFIGVRDQPGNALARLLGYWLWAALAALALAFIYKLGFRRERSVHEGINAYSFGFAENSPKVVRLLLFQAMGMDMAWHHLRRAARLLAADLSANTDILLKIIGSGHRVPLADFGIETWDDFSRRLAVFVDMDCLQLLEVYDPPEIIVTTPFREFLLANCDFQGAAQN